MYLLDTNAVIAVLKDRSNDVRQRFEQAVTARDVLLVSSVVLGELWYGIAKSRRRQQNSDRLMVFLSGPIDILAFDDEDARTVGTVRAELEANGTPIGPYDLMIAAQALRHGATLVTANVGEFKRVNGLRVEDWSGSG